MSQTNVSSCVLSIITSFSSGLDVFRKLREARSGQRRKVRKAGRPPTEEEVKLAKSLRQGPEDIGREYQRSFQLLGDGFAIGDAIAQTSLAEVLLKLNTGLVNIINNFLSREARDAQLDCRSLTVLSEKSRIDTCRTLRQLYKRMLHLRPPPVQSFPERSVSEASKSGASFQDESKRKKAVAVAKNARVRTPMIARVVVENSARPSQIALVKPGERRKKSSRPSASPKLPSASPPALTKLASTPDLTDLDQGPLPGLAHLPPRAVSREPNGVSNFGSLNVRAATTLPRPDLRRATHSTPDLGRTACKKGRVLPHPHPSVPATRLEPRRRKPTPTYYSIASGSTRLGEIPMHKWSEPYDYDAMSILNREAARNGWPVESLKAPEIAKKKRFGILRLFRKSDTKA